MKFIGKLGRVFILASLICSFGVSFAAADTIVGNWLTVDKKTGKASSVIEIWDHHGLYFGKIAKIFEVNGAKKSDTCIKCKGDRRNKPMLGLVIIRGMEKEGDKYVGGKILDPRNGKEYKCELSLGKKGKTLNVRGYMGIRLFGRTTVWYRPKD